MLFVRSTISGPLTLSVCPSGMIKVDCQEGKKCVSCDCVIHVSVVPFCGISLANVLSSFALNPDIQMKSHYCNENQAE